MKKQETAFDIAKKISADYPGFVLWCPCLNGSHSPKSPIDLPGFRWAYDFKVASYNDLHFVVGACGCWARTTDVVWEEIFSDLGFPISRARLGDDQRKQAWRNKLWVYGWSVCECGRHSDREWAEDYPGIGCEGAAYCSPKCFAMARGKECAFCGEKAMPRKYRENHFRYLDFCRRFLRRAGITHFYEEVTHVYCSRRCCSLAMIEIINNEREKRKILKEKKCVQEVKKTLAKARKSLRNGVNPEALKLLKQEFALAETLLK